MKNYILLTEIKEKEHNKNIIEYKYLYEKLTEYYQKENEFDIIGIENYKREKNELLIEETELKLNQIENKILKFEIYKNMDFKK
ncbi:MAG: hypothetical protein CMO11_04310 [Thaumarchaeota archaeon]|nr:hypothetical protein [Nitrososphaerota archaeon]|tara:strand:+ start:76 stop:327 length:252 start_codon:yes stop_codon:yes gene_type:complete